MKLDERIKRHLPAPTPDAPFAQLDYLVARIEESAGFSQRAKVNYGAKYYKNFIRETRGDEHLLNVVLDWGEDALADFQRWIEEENPAGVDGSLAPFSLSAIVGGMKAIMGHAYAHKFIDVEVFGLSRPQGKRATSARSAYSQKELEVVLGALQPAIQWSLRVCGGYKVTGKGKSPIGKPSTFHKREDLFWYWSHVVRDPSITRRDVARRHPQFYQTVAKVFGRWTAFLEMAKAEEKFGDESETLSEGEDPRFKPTSFSNADDMVWYFENVMQCKPLRSKELGQKCKALAKEVRVRYGDVESWYRSMGLALYIDGDAVIPLLYKLASETGLNAESLFTLPRDCFVKNDALTGQNYIVYWKLRSTGEKRLPVAYLDDNEISDASTENDVLVKAVGPLGIKQSLIVEKTINAILTLTAPLVDRANVKSRNLLFLYEMRGGGVRVGQVGTLTANIVATWTLKFFFNGKKRNIKNPEDVVNISRFRPTLVTEMVKRGFDIFDISVVMGHRSVITTAMYLDKHGLEAKFEIEMRAQLEQIRRNHREAEEAVRRKSNERDVIRIFPTSGLCGCRDPFNPPEVIRRATNYEEGKACGYFSMCLTCKHIVITEEFIPKLFKHLYELELELDKGLGSEPMRERLYLRQISVLRQILAPDFIFSPSTLKLGEGKVNKYVDAIYDDFLYH
ncbi:hypothetical protein AB4Y44_21660 [Paraburkholderia sp. BR10937]|uniref:hypothetical protein n=1 Tax=Paraburkholderia sp. BR10937 TaxID=3236994 RepID=UPI0034D36327